MAYIGRFAPSPTGQLHFGSLVAALASYLQARHSGGAWLIRIEDLDPPREVPGSADSIIEDLARLGLKSDEPVIFQSTRSNAYQQACDQLLANGQAYWCRCSRKDLPESGIYPGTCRHKDLPVVEQRALRLRTDGTKIVFNDSIQGKIVSDLSQSAGDFVIKRADGLFAYQLAVVIDDDFQKVSEVVRGADLLDSTPRQIWLQHCLALQTPGYAHIPIVEDRKGNKLGKRLGSDPVGHLTATEILRTALSFLGHQPPQPGKTDTVERLLSWGTEHWSMANIPALSGQVFLPPQKTGRHNP